MNKVMLSLADWWCRFTPNAVLQSLEDSQFWPPERLENLQTANLRKLLVHITAHVPFYRDLFAKTGFNPHEVRSIEDISSLPLLGKPEIMDDPARFVSDVAQKPLVWLRTSGTTGQPFRFVRTRLAQSYKIASRLRFRRWYGIERNSPLLNVGGIPSYKNSPKERLTHSLHFFLTRRFEVFSSDFKGSGAKHAATLIEKHRLKAIMGYPTGIMSLAEYLTNGRKLTHLPLAIFTNSETLTDLMRRRIHEGFGIEPRIDYVATEGSIAHECPHGGLHTNMEEALIELLPIGNSDGTKEVVVTFLHTFDFPLIRYRLGDLARWAKEPCSCGRGLHTIEKLLGRSSDGIELPDGRVFTAANINMRIAHFPFIDHVKQYQIIQRNKKNVELCILYGQDTSSEILAQFQNTLSDMFPGLNVQARIVDTLPRESTGKFRAIIGLEKQRMDSEVTN